MRSSVFVLAIVLASGCTNDDGDDGSNADGGTTGSLDGGGDVVVTPDGTTGGSDGGSTSDGSSGGFGLSMGDDESSGGEPEGFDDDFEDIIAGEQPPEPWLDVATRIDAPTVPSPTASVIDTEGPDGAGTRAVQLHDAIGTSQGLLTSIDPSPRHRVAANVRIDQLTDAVGTTWPIAVGFSQDTDAADLNDGPHAVVYAGDDGSWHLFIKNGAFDAPGLDLALPGPAIELGHWYRVLLEVDRDRGEFRAEVTDPATDEQLGEQVVLVPGWNPSNAQYDAIAFFDGEYDVTGGTQGGQASIDDVEYLPAYWGG